MLKCGVDKLVAETLYCSERSKVNPQSHILDGVTSSQLFRTEPSVHQGATFEAPPLLLVGVYLPGVSVAPSL